MLLKSQQTRHPANLYFWFRSSVIMLVTCYLSKTVILDEPHGQGMLSHHLLIISILMLLLLFLFSSERNLPRAFWWEQLVKDCHRKMIKSQNRLSFSLQTRTKVSQDKGSYNGGKGEGEWGWWWLVTGELEKRKGWRWVRIKGVITITEERVRVSEDDGDWWVRKEERVKVSEDIKWATRKVSEDGELEGRNNKGE